MAKTDQKLCKKCNEHKPYKAFTKSKQFKDGFKSTCKSCHNIQIKERYRKMLKEFHPELFDKRGDLK